MRAGQDWDSRWQFKVDEREAFDLAYRDGHRVVLSLAWDVCRRRAIGSFCCGEELASEFWCSLWASKTGRRAVSEAGIPGKVALGYAKIMLPQIAQGVAGYEKRTVRRRGGKVTPLPSD